MSYHTSSKRSPPIWLLIGARKTQVFWYQSEARTAATIWNWCDKTLSPGALLVVLYFSSCLIFLLVQTFPRPHYLPLGLRGCAPLGPIGLIIVWHFLKKCGNATMLRSVKNTVLLFINMSISWWKLYDRTCQEEIKKLTCRWYMMRVHRDVEKTRNKLDWTVETWIRLFLAQRCIYTHILIAEVNRKTNLLSWASMNPAYGPGYHKVASLQSSLEAGLQN